MKKKLTHIIKEDNFLSLSGNVIIAFFGIVNFALLARSFAPEAFGKWVIFLSASAFLDMFRFGITNTGLVRFLSAADASQRKAYLGSNTRISLFTSVSLALLLLACWWAFRPALENSDYALFFIWYPVLALVNLPWNNALVVLQAENSFGKILFLKSLNSVSLFILILIHSIHPFLDLSQLLFIWVLINLGTSLVSLVKGWDGMQYFRKAGKDTTSALLHFGKYTTFTLVGTNLLRSADTFIISFSPMGSAAVALYAIPMKLTELQQIPLRSFTATAFPKMSKASLSGDSGAVSRYFHTYSGAISYLFLLLSVLSFLFADLFVYLLGGQQYVNNAALAGTDPAAIVRVFSLYGLLLPIDRMTGIALDSINKPQINALKVAFMVAANIIGDLIAIFLFKSLMLVAVASILFTIVGIQLGIYFLRKEIQVDVKHIFRMGNLFYQEQWAKLSRGLT